MRFVLVLLLSGCATAPTVPASHTMPDPVFSSELPPEPEPAANRVVVAVASCQADDGSEVGPGIMMSPEMAQHAARVRIRYDEMRGLYSVDLRTMDREREIYQRELGLADDEVARLTRRAQRTWWERNKGAFGLATGVILGVVVTVGALAATNGVRP